jgi:hypothetical protein
MVFYLQNNVIRKSRWVTSKKVKVKRKKVNKIDKFVYKLYNLTYEEMKIAAGKM